MNEPNSHTKLLVRVLFTDILIYTDIAYNLCHWPNHSLALGATLSKTPTPTKAKCGE